MALSKTQEAMITKLQAVGGGEVGVGLDDGTCSYLVAVIARDLGLLKHFGLASESLPPFFSDKPLSTLTVRNLRFRSAFEKLIGLKKDSDAFFYCLAAFHKARLKYERILQAQPFPTIDQVGPRGLLQYGSLSAKGLVALLFWRKWLYDIDNRAAQETGYAFEPIMAYAIGGIAVSAKKSPVRRGGQGSEGRQVDCLRESDKRAYEIKLRVTIAASGQGRWSEELEYPKDCRKSGYIPVLIVFDPTENPKLSEIRDAFHREKGESYVGSDAWRHLESKAGDTLAVFIDTYMRHPLQALLKAVPEKLPEMRVIAENGALLVYIGDEVLRIPRQPDDALASDPPNLPEDSDDTVPL